MTITNDIIEFVDADFSALSPFARRSLEAYFRTGSPFPVSFATQLNQIVSVSKEILLQSVAKEPLIDEIVKGIAGADEAKRAEIDPLLTQIADQLKAAPVGEVVAVP